MVNAADSFDERLKHFATMRPGWDGIEPEQDYVEYELDVENGVITGCRFFGEGKQVEPLDGIKVYVPAGQTFALHFDRWLERAERRLKRALARLTSG